MSQSRALVGLCTLAIVGIVLLSAADHTGEAASRSKQAGRRQLRADIFLFAAASAAYLCSGCSLDEAIARFGARRQYLAVPMFAAASPSSRSASSATTFDSYDNDDEPTMMEKRAVVAALPYSGGIYGKRSDHLLSARAMPLNGGLYG